jgi:hypothetical protein
MRRWALALIIGSATPILTAQSTPPVSIELSEHGGAERERIDAAARLAIASYAEWLGPPPFERLVIRDSLSVPADIAIRIRWWEAPGQMWVESKVAEAIALAWLARVTTNDEWKHGAAAYLESRIVEQLFDRQFFLKAYRYNSTCFFGCYVGWSFRSLPLDRWTAMSNPVGRAFATLERELGWPTLQGALRVAAAEGGSDPIGVMSVATGRDLRPVFDAAARNPVDLDHEIVSLESTPATSCTAPCYRTVVGVRVDRVLPLPLTLRVAFADGQHIEMRFDGAGHGSFGFESPTPAVAAHLDPDHVFQLDRNLLNNARVPSRETNVPVTKWMARWIVWLQDAILTHTFPV